MPTSGTAGTCQNWQGSPNRAIVAASGIQRNNAEQHRLIRMPIEVYQGQVLDSDQLEALRIEIEKFDTIEEVDPELRGIIERNWPHLVAKLPRDDV